MSPGRTPASFLHANVRVAGRVESLRNPPPVRVPRLSLHSWTARFLVACWPAPSEGRAPNPAPVKLKLTAVSRGAPTFAEVSGRARASASRGSQCHLGCPQLFKYIYTLSQAGYCGLCARGPTAPRKRVLRGVGVHFHTPDRCCVLRSPSVQRPVLLSCGHADQSPLRKKQRREPAAVHTGGVDANRPGVPCPQPEEPHG